jgi:beta-glucosidase
MTSYNKINGVWSHYSYDLAVTILRGEWGFDGCVMTDWWMERGSSPEFPGLYDNAYRVRARVNVEMPGGVVYSDKSFTDNDSIPVCLKKGTLTRAELQQNARDVLKAAIRKL